MRVLGLFVLAALVAGPRGPLQAGPKGLQVAGPKGPALRDSFEDALSVAKDLPRLHSLLVSRRGELVLERYFNGAGAARPANIKSASKSIISALVGIAIDRRLIPGVEASIVTWFPELTKDRDQAKRAITIEDLLTMRSGLETTSNRNYGAWVQSRNWVQHALGRPLVSEPGTQMEYSTGNTHLLSAILSKATRVSTWQFANDALAAPLGFTLARWPQDPQGIYFGGNDMLLTPPTAGKSCRSRGLRARSCRAPAPTGAIRSTGTAGGFASWAGIAHTTPGDSAVSTSSSCRISIWSSSPRHRRRSPRIGAVIAGMCSTWSNT
jgi:CubicO group peptidase (beta-lactamase class C family)